MSEPLLTKRLHISGLTPSITPADLERRMSSFGKVIAMDGFGARGALGDPRKFAFVTVEIGAKELAKCLNVLSGSTWRGAKLRIGEAKPDFRERLAKVQSQPSQPVQPRRIHAHNYGYPSSTLPLTPLSVAAAASTPGWIATPSGRVVRPMRMRPERPLEPMLSELGVSNVKSVNGKVKKRVKPPPTRARRRLIDPTKWDSVYLKGVFLDSISIPLLAPKEASVPYGLMKCDTVNEDEEMTKGDDTGSDAVSSIIQKESESLQCIPQLTQDRACAFTSVQQSQETVPATSLRIQEATEFSDVRDEANAALTLLGKMFEDDEDWGGRESVNGMEDLEGNQMTGNGVHVDGVDDVKIVPCDFGMGEGSMVTKKDKDKGKERLLKEVRFSHENGMDLEAVHDVDVPMADPPVDLEVSGQTAAPPPRISLKDLFTSREEASFSLLDHLDLNLDLELDVDILGTSAPCSASQKDGHSSEPILPTSHVVHVPTTTLSTNAGSRVELDPTLPLLFPSSESLPHSHITSNPTATVHRRCAPTYFLFPSATRVRGLHHLPPSITFTRSPQDTSESIRETWEREKLSLTREWKKVWREAKRTRRGRVGAGGEVSGGH